jgi:hypothetical protein
LAGPALQPAWAASAAVADAASSGADSVPLSLPSDVQAYDRPNDNGGAIIVTWTISRDDTLPAGLVTGYSILRSSRSGGQFEVVGRAAAGMSRFVDVNAEAGIPFYYKVAAEEGEQTGPSPPVGPVTSTYQWINWDRWNHLLLGLLLCGAVVFFIRIGQRGQLRFRRLPGVDAMEKAIAQAAETGRPIFFVTGSEDLNEIQTIAGLNVLEQVSRRMVAREADLRVPQFHSLVMAASDDTLYYAYAGAGRPEGYDRDDAFYVSDEQFGFVAGVAGLMCREEPIACFYFGSFYAESLALTEVGQTIGAVQVAGTAERAQIPFLLTACDHVLIGEEMFAAAAYLSRDPRQLGALRGQDFGKLLAIGAIAVGCVLATLTSLIDSNILAMLRDGLLSIFETGVRR